MHLDRTGDDDSRIDQDTYLYVYTKIGDVEAWTHGVWENQKPETSETYDPVSFDEWDSKPEEPMDSIRVLDCERWVVEIGDWQEHCTQLRGTIERTATGRRVGYMDMRRLQTMFGLERATMRRKLSPLMVGWGCSHHASSVTQQHCRSPTCLSLIHRK